MLGEKDRVSVFSWIFTFIVLAIPVINVIYFIVLLCGGSKFESKVTFARAILLSFIIGVVILLAVGILAFGGIQDLFNTIKEYIQQIIEAIKSGNFVIM